MRTHRLVGLAGVFLLSHGRPCAAGPEPAAVPSALDEAHAEAAGALAPLDAWTVEGGSSSHSGESAAPPVRGPLEVAWTFEVKESVEEEPRAFGDRVFVSEIGPGTRRTLHVVGSRDGKERYRQRFDGAPRRLSPAVGPRDVVLFGEHGLERWTVGEHMLTKQWTVDAPYAFVRRRDVIWTVDGRGVTRAIVERGPGSPSASTTDVDLSLASAIAVRGTSAFVLGYDGPGNGFLVSLDADTLQSRGRAFVVTHDGAKSSGASILAGPAEVFVRTELPISTKSGRPANVADVALLGGITPIEHASLLSMPVLPVFSGTRWLAVWDSDDGERQLARPSATQDHPGSIRFDLFASSKDAHAAFVALHVPPTVARGVVYVNGGCFDPDTREVFRDATWSSPIRVVPVRDLLLVTIGNRVTAYRESRSTPSAALVPIAPAPGAPPGPVTVGDAVVALADGSFRTGSFTADPATVTLVPIAKGGDRSPVPLANALAVVSAASPRRILFARDVASAVAGLDAVVARESAKDWLAAARDALAAGAADVAERCAAEAGARGAPEGDVAKLSQGAAALAAKDKPADAKKLDAVRTRVAALEARPADVLSASVAALPADAPFSLRVGLVRALLSRRPTDPPALAWIRESIPKEITPQEPFEADEWLRFVEATHRAPVSILSPPKKGEHERDLTYQRKQLGSALHFWREDLVALESGPLLILSPVKQPGRIARCLATGRAVCDVLEALCASGTAKRDLRYPLTHHLYESKDEYLRESTKGEKRGVREAAMRALEYTAGHYDPWLELSRMYLPSDPRGFDRILSTYAHELTHHWMDRRCPLFTEAEARRAGGAGYWVVEGIAEFVGEMRFDAESDLPPTPNPRALSLDVVGHCAPDALLPWGPFFDADSGDKEGLPTKGVFEVPTHWKLGFRHVLSPMDLFYCQAAAASHYLLLAEGGRYKPEYVAYLADHYTGRVATRPFATRFGATPAEMGRRIVEWARRRSEGDTK